MSDGFLGPFFFPEIYELCKDSVMSEDSSRAATARGVARCSSDVPCQLGRHLGRSTSDQWLRMEYSGLVQSDSMDLQNDPRFFSGNVLNKRLSAFTTLSVVSSLMVIWQET